MNILNPFSKDLDCIVISHGRAIIVNAKLHVCPRTDDLEEFNNRIVNFFFCREEAGRAGNGVGLFSMIDVCTTSNIQQKMSQRASFLLKISVFDRSRVVMANNLYLKFTRN